MQGSRKRGEHTLDCVKHRGSRCRSEFVFKKRPLFLPFSFLPCPIPFFSSTPFCAPCPARIFSACPYPFHPTCFYSSATEDDLRDNSRRALVGSRARAFFLSPFYFFLLSSTSFFPSFFSFFFLLFSTDSNRVRAACRGSRTNAYFTRTRASTSRNEKARVRAEGSARGSESAGA